MSFAYSDSDLHLDQLLKLKEFHPSGLGTWADVDEADWNNWRWQLKNRVSSLEGLQSRIPDLTPQEVEGARLADTKLAMAITPHFFNLINGNDPDCPIRRQMLPSVQETETAPWEMGDPCGEDSHSPVPGLVHRYP
ncbi:MAG: lysine 2,3-aminomutase, partial [Limisphaerales bacterium]